MPTFHKFIAAVAILALAMVGNALHLPSLALPVLIILGSVFYIWYVMRGQSQRAQQRTEPPTSDTSMRLYAALSRAKIPGEAVTWVSGLGNRPFIKRSSNRLLISGSMVDQLSDDELVAMVLQVWLVHPAAYWMEFARTPGPWLALAGIVGQPIYNPAVLLVLAGLIWSVYSNASGKVTTAVALKGGRTFLTHGGDMVQLLGALTKNYTALLDAIPQSRADLARTANRVLCSLAVLANISEGQLSNIVVAAGGASDILQPPEAPRLWAKHSPFFPLFRWLLITALLLGVSVYVAMSLGK